jgi:hypothetical protein
MLRRATDKVVEDARQERKWVALTALILIGSLAAPGPGQSFEIGGTNVVSYFQSGRHQIAQPTKAVVTLSTLDLGRLTPAAFGDRDE